jgi:pimeloyl-[acyl-carrier protein] methyl ester esterase
MTTPLSGKTIVFLPGLDGTGLSFGPFGRVLPPDVSVEVVRYPVDRLLSFKQTVVWARDWIGQGREEVVILAESFSGPVAIELISSGQIKARCLILCATFARSPRPVLLRILGCLPLARLIRLALPPCLLKHFIAGSEEVATLFIDLWQSIKALVPARVLVHRLKTISRVDVRERLTQLAIPCLYIQAAGDRTVPASCLLDFTRAVTDLRVACLQGPHFILQAKPLESLAVIEDFLSYLCCRGNLR